MKKFITVLALMLVLVGCGQNRKEINIEKIEETGNETLLTKLLYRSIVYSNVKERGH